MQILLAIALALSFHASAQSTQSNQSDCRQAVVAASVDLNTPLAPNEFSVMNGSAFTLSAEEFNSLSAEEQGKIYLKLRPLKSMVEELIEKTNGAINYLSQDPYAALFRADLLQTLRSNRDQLRSCSL